ncbi:hypothetical protein ACWC4E_33150 [Streptomyces sp. NPDC001273]|uniref:hypothetical protein n=1 Tax=unclassified Streptomyces TaxID=2593676 RepID=UPI0033EA5FFA
MTPTSTTLTRPAPVPVTIGLRPPAEAAGTLPVPIPTPPVPEGAFQIIGDLNIDVAESAGGSPSAGDDQPYETGAPLRHAAPAVRWPGQPPLSSRNRAVSMIRRQFHDLPAAARQAIASKVGPVHAARTAEGGLNSGIAAFLDTDHGPVFACSACCRTKSGIPHGRRSVSGSLSARAVVDAGRHGMAGTSKPPEAVSAPLLEPPDVCACRRGQGR